MYSEAKKNIENSDAPTSRPTTLAPVRVGSRKIRNGTSGSGGSLLDRDEGADQRDRDRDQDDRLGRAPARLLGVDDRVDEQREAGGDRHRAGDVEVARARPSERLSAISRGAK